MMADWHVSVWYTVVDKMAAILADYIIKHVFLNESDKIQI